MAAKLPEGFTLVDEPAAPAPSPAPQAKLPEGFTLVAEEKAEKESPVRFSAPSNMIEVEHPDPRIGVQRFKFGTPDDQILRDINRKEIELAKIDVASPQLRIREEWQKIEDAKDRGEIDAIQAQGMQMRLMTEMPITQAGAAMAARIGLPLVGESLLSKRGLGAVGRVGGSMIGEAVALGLEDEPITAGKILGAGISSAPGGVTGSFAKTLRNFMGASALGKATEEAVDQEALLSFKKAAEAAAEGGAGAAGLKLLSTAGRKVAGSLARKGEYALIKTMIGANDLGVIVDPTIYSNAVPKTGLVKIAGGNTKFQEAASRINEVKVREAAESILGVPANTSFDRAFFVQQRKLLAQPYEAIAALSDDAKTALKDWRQANETFVNSTRAAARETNPKSRIELRDAAQAAKTEADNAFKLIESEAMRTGNGYMVKDLTEARKQLARLHAIDAAVNTSSGRIEYPEVWGVMREELRVPFDGKLEQLARISATMPEVLRSGPALRRAQPIKGLKDMSFGETVSAATALPIKALMAGPQAAAQATLMSPFYQRSITQGMMGNRPGIPQQLGRFLASEYATQAMEEPRPVPYR
jgi:hypothetical protein